MNGIYTFKLNLWTAFISGGSAVDDKDKTVYTTADFMDYKGFNLWRCEMSWKERRLSNNSSRKDSDGLTAVGQRHVMKSLSFRIELMQYQPRTKLIIIVPPVARAIRKRATRNALNQGEKADNTPAAACSPIAKIRGILRPILQTTGTQEL
jgi:hypothetical protein